MIRKKPRVSLKCSMVLIFRNGRSKGVSIVYQDSNKNVIYTNPLILCPSLNPPLTLGDLKISVTISTRRLTTCVDSLHFVETTLFLLPFLSTAEQIDDD